VIEPIRVLVLSDDPLIRAGLNAVLVEEESLEVIGQSALAELSESLLEAFLPDAILIECETLRPELQTNLLAFMVPYVVLTDTVEQGSIGRHIDNQIPRNSEVPLLRAALHAVTVGLTVRPAVSKDHDHRLPLEISLEELTARETEVLQLIAEGLTNRAIGQSLSIKESTVKFHVNKILDKLGVQSRTEAIAVALRYGLISL
jgi:DNA-binding NarL/FixJ family response regulator